MITNVNCVAGAMPKGPNPYTDMTALGRNGGYDVESQRQLQLQREVEQEAASRSAVAGISASGDALEYTRLDAAVVQHQQLSEPLERKEDAISMAGTRCNVHGVCVRVSMPYAVAVTGSPMCRLWTQTTQIQHPLTVSS